MRCIGISATGARAIAQTGGHSGDGRGGTYGKLNVVQERVAVRDGWAIDVFSLVSVSTSLLEKLAERA